jgi:lipopolysaccharide transport system ATP-binding protein
MNRVVLENVSVSYPVAGFLTSTNSNRPHNVGSLIGRAKGSTNIYALRDVSVIVDEGERIAVVGGNGSGKTTILKVVAGIFQPTAGEVTVSGRCMAIFNIGIGTSLEATGRRNIILRGLIAGLTTKEIEAKIPEIANFSELGPYLDLPVRTYSQGMALRLAFATTTAFEPEILVLDEWLGAGDQAFQAKATKRMQEFVGKAGSLWFASHNHKLLRSVCNKCLWLEAGHMRAFGDIEDVLSQYEDELKIRVSKI